MRSLSLAESGVGTRRVAAKLQPGRWPRSHQLLRANRSCSPRASSFRSTCCRRALIAPVERTMRHLTRAFTPTVGDLKKC
jgi:hypothetical protein